MIHILNAKKAKLLEQERTFLNSCSLHLYTYAGAISDDMDPADLTEPSDGGYLPVTLAYTPATLNGDNQAELAGPPIVFTFDHDAGNFTVYGYFVKDPGDGGVVYVDDNGAPQVISIVGATYTVVPGKLMDTMPAA